MIYIYCAYACASYSLFVIYLFALFYSLLIVHSFCSLFDYFVSFSSILCLFVVQREKDNSDPGSCSRYFDPVNRRSNLLPVAGYLLPVQVPIVVPDQSPSSLRDNKHHTADSTYFVLV